MTNLAKAERPGLRQKHLQFEQEFVHGHQPSSWKENSAEYLRGRGDKANSRATQGHAGATPEPRLAPVLGFQPSLL